MRRSMQQTPVGVLLRIKLLTRTVARLASFSQNNDRSAACVCQAKLRLSRDVQQLFAKLSHRLASDERDRTGTK
ncbi:unnamed protein product [Chondrus crispus]|uniref:Uncharacterized protein n=1 Tax=Chondrus crispus TaxID=2769 RepID=R7QBH3_CHOCR|nr:unnamed protein product [Chondrus crispus]XP_005714945.1 unnamed protein product [Chondrus crispus]CDF35123.1 unnamed protein product [Chondrus crispus]CDF35126.1 unnamed protein product [Chondrus crispus]|eukprot:XP_005714942.1 unnamed protein product [Chondrus crispus]